MGLVCTAGMIHTVRHIQQSGHSLDSLPLCPLFLCDESSCSIRVRIAVTGLILIVKLGYHDREGAIVLIALIENQGLDFVLCGHDTKFHDHEAIKSDLGSMLATFDDLAYSL